jgi:uncharacterized protein (TIGR01244 family)
MRHLAFLLGIALLVACSDRPPGQRAEGAGSASLTASVPIPEPAPCQIEGMENCAKTGDVLIGSQPTEAALETLAAQGYKTVVTTRAEGEIDWDEQAKVESLGMRFVRIPMPSPVTEISDDQVAQLDAVLSGGAGPTVLHCGSGNRVSGLWAVWLAADRGLAPSEALRLAALAGMGSVRPAVERRMGIDSIAQ